MNQEKGLVIYKAEDIQHAADLARRSKREDHLAELENLVKRMEARGISSITCTWMSPNEYRLVLIYTKIFLQGRFTRDEVLRAERVCRGPHRRLEYAQRMMHLLGRMDSRRPHIEAKELNETDLGILQWALAVSHEQGLTV